MYRRRLSEFLTGVLFVALTTVLSTSAATGASLTVEYEITGVTHSGDQYSVEAVCVSATPIAGGVGIDTVTLRVSAPEGQGLFVDTNSKVDLDISLAAGTISSVAFGNGGITIEEADGTVYDPIQTSHSFLAWPGLPAFPGLPAAPGEISVLDIDAEVSAGVVVAISSVTTLGSPVDILSVTPGAVSLVFHDGLAAPAEWVILGPLVPDEPEIIEATVSFAPRVVNLKTKPNSLKTLMCLIELPEGAAVEDIDASSLLLVGEIPIVADSALIGDIDEDGIPDLSVKFSQAALIAWLDGTTGEVALDVTGFMADDSGIIGVSTVNVINPGKKDKPKKPKKK